MAAGASFVARAVDKDPVHLASVLKQAYEHPGCSFVEIYQDCNIFNHSAFDEFSLKANRADNTVQLTDGKPLVFGKENEWSLALHGDELQRVASLEAHKYRHDTTSFLAAMRLARLHFPEYPVPLGVYYQKPRDAFTLPCTFKKTTADLPALFRAKASWQQRVS